MSCITMHEEDIDDVYSLSLVNYAHSLYDVDDTRARNVRDRLRATAVDEGLTLPVYSVIKARR